MHIILEKNINKILLELDNIKIHTQKKLWNKKFSFFLPSNTQKINKTFILTEASSEQSWI